MPNQNNYTLLKLNIIGYDGTVVDIMPNFTAIELYESIDEPFISGIITLSDQRNLLEELPIVGDETIELEFHDLPQNFSTGAAVSKTQRFDITKVEDIKVMSPHSTSYTIHFISKAFLKNSSKRIRNAYNKNPSVIVSDFVTGHLESNMNWITESVYDTHVVFPNLTAVDCISLLSEVSVDNNGSGGFVFYESYDGFNFVTQDWLIKQPVIKTYDNSIVATYTKNSKAYKIEDTYNTTAFDIIHNVNNGMYGNTTMNHNLINKKITESAVSYDKMFGMFNHINKKPLTEKHKLSNTLSSFLPVGNNGLYKNISDWYGNTLSRLTQFENNVWTFTINGDDSLVAGGIIKVKLPKRGKFINSTDNARESSKYLIVSLKRLITPEKYTSIIQVVGESNNV